MATISAKLKNETLNLIEPLARTQQESKRKYFTGSNVSYPQILNGFIRRIAITALPLIESAMARTLERRGSGAHAPSRTVRTRIMDRVSNSASREKVALQLNNLRDAGDLNGAIALCGEAARLFPNDYFYPQIASDLHFQRKEYDAAAEALMECLRKNLPRSSNKRFEGFARRYNRLRRARPQEETCADHGRDQGRPSRSGRWSSL